MLEESMHNTVPFGDLDYWLSEWLKSRKRKSPHTKEAYTRDVRQFLEARKVRFDLATVQDIQEYQSALTDAGLADKTIARKLAALRSFYRLLNNREVTSINLARIEHESIAQEINYERMLTEKEIKAIIAAAGDPVHRLFVRLLYLTALRVSEALALRWRDLTPLDEGGEAHVIGKGKKQRNVFLPAVLWNDLHAARGASEDSAPIFPALTRSIAAHLVKKLAKAAKVDKEVSPHSFRHAHISHALKRGATLAELRDQAGHANISTTSLYAHADHTKATATRLQVQ